MSRMVLSRVLNLVVVLFLVTLATFFMLELVPGDPAVQVLGPDAAPEQYALVRERLGLNEPAVDRYLDWLGGIVRGDFGETVLPPSQKVADLITSRLPITLEIALLSMLMSLAAAVPIGVMTAARQGEPVDRAISGALYAALSIPSFLLALLLIFVAIFHSAGLRGAIAALGVLGAVALVIAAARRARAGRWRDTSVRARVVVSVVGAIVVAVAAILLATHWPAFPRRGFVRLTSGQGLWPNLRSAFLPALTLAIGEVAVFSRLLRSDMITTLQEDYILAARSRGIPRRRILFVHALRPSTFSLVTVAGVSLGRLIGGTVVVEQVFGIPGMGTLLVNAINAKDYRVVQGAVLLVAAFYVILNVLVDLSYAYLDPRTARGRAA